MNWTSLSKLNVGNRVSFLESKPPARLDGPFVLNTDRFRLAPAGDPFGVSNKYAAIG